jgi:TolB-like protein
VTVYPGDHQNYYIEIDFMPSPQSQKSGASKKKIPPDVIWQEVTKICASTEFVTKGRSCQLLRYLIKETLHGRGDQLIQYTIGQKVFDRKEDFNPDLDPIVRIQAGRLRRSLDIYYLTEGKEDPVRISILRGSYQPVFLRHTNPDSQSSTESQDPIHEMLPFTSPSIAIFPFKNLTGNPDREFFVLGFSEELTQELTRYEDFRILSLRMTPDTQQEASINGGQNLSVDSDFIIEGAVREQGEQIKISATLTQTKSREQLWGEQYLRQMTAGDLITIQEEISQHVITTIAGEYGIIPQRISLETRQKQVSELSVYESLLRYYYYQAQQTPETARDAYDALQNALTKDPDCASALAMLASLDGNIYMLDRTGSADALTRMIELSRRAIELDPNNQLVSLIHAWTYFVLNDRDRFFNEIERTLSLNPNSSLRLGTCGFFIALYGDWDRGKLLLDRVMASSIGYPRWYHGATTAFHYRKKDYKNAYQEALQYDVPGLFWGPMLRLACLGQFTTKDGLSENLEELKALKPDFTEKARDLISRYVKEEELVEHILEGLKKAGLTIIDQ